MRIEITAKMPTQATSACPAIYLSNATEQYARYAETGVISMFEMIPSSSLSQSMVQFVHNSTSRQQLPNTTTMGPT